MEQEDIKFIEDHLREMWSRLSLDHPSNWDSLLKYVIEDVRSSSSYLLDGDYHSGDIEIAFRRFFEMAYYEDNFDSLKKKKLKFKVKISIKSK